MKILRQHITSRGGGIEVSLDKQGYEGERMTAYQNYLGGGMLGRVCNDCTIPDWRDYPTLVKIAKKVREKYGELADINVEDYEEYPESAY
jgi:hypothetical protein